MLHPIVRASRWLAFVLLALAAGSARAEASHCGGLNEPACTVIDAITHGFVGCQSGLAEVPFPGGTCIQLDAQGFPPFCGGANERPCRLNEHIPSCKSGLVEHFGLDRCIQVDSDGFPSICGGAGERPCTIVEHVPSCKPGLVEDFEANRCGARDSAGFPEFCGGANERPCSIIEHIPSCKPDLVEHLPTNRCIQLDGDGFPAFCGGETERACAVIEHIPSCKPGLQEKPRIVDGSLLSICEGPPPDCGREGQRACTLIEHIPSCQPGLQEKLKDVDGTIMSICESHPLDCGRNGQRACTITEFFPSCKPGLSEMFLEFNDCAREPADRNETDADERPRGGRRTVFFIHGGDTDLGTGATTPPLVQRLLEGGPNLGPIYAVDWNHAGDAPRRLQTFGYGGGCGVNQVCTGEWGVVEFDRDTFTFPLVGYALAEAIRTLPTEPDVTLIGHGIGGLFARHVVQRHYDELRAAGKRIAEVITIGAPNQGILAAGVDVHIGDGARLQTDAACLAPLFGDVADNTGCQVGRWIDRVNGGNPGGISDARFPQIRWISVAGNGQRLHVGPTMERARAGGSDTADFVDFLESLATDDVFHDSDGLVTTRSAFGLLVDGCYPFSREINPNGLHPATRHTLRLYEAGTGGVPTSRLAFSGYCLNPDASVDPRIAEGVGPDGSPRQLDFVGNQDLVKSPHVQNFVLASLHLFGDTNGDGAVNELDLQADAGPDQTIECAGAATQVQLDASGSILFGGDAAVTWSGPFGIATGMTPVVDLGPGTHTIVLTIEQGGFQSTDEVVITIADTTPPMLTVPAGFTREATDAAGTPFAFAIEASDACGGVSVRRAPHLDAYPFGSTEVVVTVTDDSGNSTAATVTVTIVDTTSPVLSVPADVIVEANAVLSTAAIGMATATDIFPVTVQSDAPPVFPLGRTDVTWIATDANSNSAQGVQHVTVVDTTPPVLSVPPDVTLIAAGPNLTDVEIGSAAATDIFGVTVTHDAPAGFPIGTTVVTWTAVDANGNRATGAQTVQVVYAFGGFGSPIQPGGTYKANRNLPLKFTLFFADGTPAAGAEAALSVTPAGAGGTAGEAIDISANGLPDSGTAFRFTGSHYHFNLSTLGWPPGIYRVTVTADDGGVHSMEINLK